MRRERFARRAVGRHLLVNGFCDARRERGAWRDEHGSGIGIVFGLRDEIGGDP